MHAKYSQTGATVRPSSHMTCARACMCVRVVAFMATTIALPLFARTAMAAHSQQRDEVGALRQEADRGNANAQFDLGVRYATGKGVAHNDAGRDHGNIRIGHRIGQHRPRQRPGIELRHDITAMTTRQDWVVDDRKSRAPAGWFVIHRACCDEPIAAPAQIIGHESGRQRLAHRLARVPARKDDQETGKRGIAIAQFI